MSEAGTATAATVYAEQARTYRSLTWSVVALGVAFVLDVLVSGGHGALTHLPGWLVFGALLLGVHGLAVHAVRATHSLQLTDDELAVGDEVVAREQIVGVTPGVVADPDLPTLGWPNGFPRRAGGVTLRLADGRDVLVPARFPDRLHRALQVGAPEPERPPEVRVAGEADLAQVPSVAERAAAIFRVAGYVLPGVPPAAGSPDAVALDDASPDAGPADGVEVVLVVGDPVVGVAQVEQLDGAAHLRGLSVLPGAMRRGHGTRLLEAACAWAAEHGHPALTLTTYTDVPWNGPFFTARGFSVDDAPGPELQALRAREREAGLDAVGRRVVMRRALSPSTPAG